MFRSSSGTKPLSFALTRRYASLFQREAVKHQPFEDINRDCIPVFATSFPTKAGNMWVKRLQVPVSPAFALTEYKVQGSTYQNVVLDLHRPSKPHGQDGSHKRYCSVYVQLTRPRSLKGLHLLQPLSLDDLGNQLHPKLQDEDHRLQRLADIDDAFRD